MTKRSKQILIITLSIIFMACGSYLILSLYGFVINTKTLSLEKTGSISMSYNKKEATLIINGMIKKTSPNLLWGTVLINRLKPGTYKIELLQPGFHPYKKNVTVEEGLVTRLEGVTLWPLVFEEHETTTTTIKNFYATKNGVILEKEEGLMLENGKSIRGKKVIANDIESTLIIVEENREWYLLDLNRPNALTNINVQSKYLAQKEIQENIGSLKAIEHFPKTEGVFLLKTTQGTYEYDSKNITIRKAETPELMTKKEKLKGEYYCSLENEKNIKFVNIKTNASNTLYLADKIKELLNSENSCFGITEKNHIFQVTPQENIKYLGEVNAKPKIVAESKDGDFFLIATEKDEVYIGTNKYDEEGVFRNPNMLEKLPLTLENIKKIEFLAENPKQILIENEKGLILTERDWRGGSVNNILLKAKVKKQNLKENILTILTDQGKISKIIIESK